MAELKLNGYINVILDAHAGQGIRKIGAKVASDVERVTGAKTQVIQPGRKCSQAIIVAVLGEDGLADELAERIPVLSDLAGKWECYAFCVADHPMEEIRQGLVIVGSDRLGTIYGMFHLSELLGVTAWGFWGDVEPPFLGNVVLTDLDADTYLRSVKAPAAHESESRPHELTQKDNRYAFNYMPEEARRSNPWEVQDKATVIHVENGLSKEPSVRYRGFFINDEWPCFGNWTYSHYQGFTSEMYDHIFEYLLRLKGNYLWPAMWSSSFLLDGPGLASMELATEYGIYIGMSHHEPCMRSGEEFSIFKGEDSPYGNDWDFVKNRDGLLKFWEDGLSRVEGQNIFPTIGMRGENDSRLLGVESTVEENVSLLKEIITEQKKLIARHTNPDQKPVPKLLAIYKEVEDYYFGNDKEAGLEGFDELDDVVLMFCEDNFNNMRALPQHAHAGGFGMYYHADYHGSPISYEWVNSTPVMKIWEQMTEAYEYGVRDVWIMNVGDVKFNEYPLGYFMALAYDFDSYGVNGYERSLNYPKEWVRSLFGSYADEEQLSDITWVLEESVRLHSLRRAESLNDKIYHPAHYKEGQEILARAEALEEKNEALRASFAGTALENGYYSLIYYPAAGIANLLKMHLYSGMNHLYASQGKAIANVYGEKMMACIEKDRNLADELAAFSDGKWEGMEREQHIGFVNWNEEDYRYPVRHELTLPKDPRLVVSRADREESFTNQYFIKPLVIDDFKNAGTDEVTLQIANGGRGTVEWYIENSYGDGELYEITPAKGNTELQTEVRIRVRREKLPAGVSEVHFRIWTQRECVLLVLFAENPDLDAVPSGAFLMQDGVCVLDPADAAEVRDLENAAYKKIEKYGKYGTAMKVLPTTAVFTEKDWEKDAAPSLTYEVWTEEAGSCELQLHTSPANPLIYNGQLRCGVAVNGQAPVTLTVTDENYRGGDPGCEDWCEGVLAHEHVASLSIRLEEGLNRIRVYAGDAGLALERLTLIREGAALWPSYFGPPVSYRKQ